MICDHCGRKNESNARYCIECGEKLSSRRAGNESVHCSSCGCKNDGSARFCSACGKKLEKVFQNSAKKSQNKPNEKKKKSEKKAPQQSAGKYIALAAFLVLIVFIALQFTSTFSNKPLTNNIPQVPTRVQPFDARVLQVASIFRCSCGSCGGTPLETCACETATAEKAFIAESLQKGASMESVIAAVDSTYGWMKDEFKEQYNSGSLD